MKQKKLLLLITVCWFIFTSVAFGQELGDVNSDSNIDIVDALIIAQVYVGIPVVNFHAELADFNCNGEIDIIDCLQIAQFYVGLITPPCSATEISTDTQFLYGRGFYTESFTEVITTEIPGATIYYTLDGSDPRNSVSVFTGTSPVNVKIDPADKSKRPLTPAVTLRAYAKNNANSASNVDTQTYIFVESVKTQSAASPGTGWPAPGQTGFFPGYSRSQLMDYGMDPDVVNDPRYKDQMTEALMSLPSISLVTDLGSLFAEDTGIYVNATEKGDEWERQGSVEIIYPNADEDSVQAETGIRIRNGYHRIASNPKHAFRLYFRKDYGDSKLEYKLFGDEGVEEFNRIDLRTATNYNWAFYGDRRNTMIRDVVSRDIQAETGQPYTRSRYYHLYLNGIYWGLYQTQERSEASYAESYFGGIADEYDVIKAGSQDNGNTLEVTDGNPDLTANLHAKMIAGFESNTAYFDVLGCNPDGTENPAGQKLVDPENLADYMLGVFYTGDKDGPISTFYNHGLNNFYGIINRHNPDGFKWFHHDAEHTFDVGAVDRIGPFADSQWERFEFFNPQILNEYLMENQEYSMLFADRAYRHLCNNGAMSPETVTALVNKRASEIDPGGVIANSARWGDMQSRTPLNYEDHWKPAVQTILSSFIPSRSSQIITLLKQKDWYPAVDPPAVSYEGELLAKRITELDLGSELVLESTAGGTIYYTTNGSDPRTVGGEINAAALDGGEAITVALTAAGIKARILLDGEWSALREVFTMVSCPKYNILITEINYNPQGTADIDERDFEFIELHNNTASPINLTGFSFTKGILYNFPTGSVLPANAYIIIAAQPRAFMQRYGFKPFGQYFGKLENSGDKVTLKDGFGSTVFSVKFDDKDPWPESADGAGYSLVPVDENSGINPDENTYWTASAELNGSPGTKDKNSN